MTNIPFYIQCVQENSAYIFIPQKKISITYIYFFITFHDKIKKKKKNAHKALNNHIFHKSLIEIYIKKKSHFLF